MKGLNPKEILMQHGEKMAFGLIVIATLFVLKSTRWSPYQKAPQELVKLSKEADQKIDQSQWPEEKRQELMPEKDIIARSAAMREGINTADFAFSTPMYTPIYPKSEPIKEPDFLTVEDAVATAGEVLIQLPPEVEESEEVADADSEDPEVDDSDIPEALRKKKRSSGTTGEYGEIPGAPVAGTTPGEEGSGEYGEYPFGPGMMEGETEKVELNGEGYRFVSVRGVIDWQTVKRNYAEALNLPPDEAAFVEPDIVDFTIERQRAASKTNPWSEPWEPLDISNSVEVLDKAYDFEADTVDVTITDPVITEPLPRRVLGIWGKHATHPRVENFELSEEEIRREQLRQQKLIEAYEAMRKQSGQLEPLEEGGFSSHAYNVRSMQDELGRGGNSEYIERFDEEYRSDMESAYSENPNYYGARPGSATPGEGGLLTTARSKASGRLLLFRYFDFDVEPGAVYRYRIQIEYKNPNFGKPIELLESPDVAEGRTKKSDWSAPTNPVQVRPKSDYFLTNVDFDRARRQNLASLDLYQWNAPTGTVVNETIRVTIGDRIADDIQTKVVNPLDESYEPQDLTVDSGHVLVDLKDNADLEIDSQLEDLGKVPPTANYDEILVLDEQGQLVAISPRDREAKRVAAKRFQKFQNQLGEEYEEAAKEASEAEKFLMGDEYGGEGYGGEGYGARPSSASRRRGGS